MAFWKGPRSPRDEKTWVCSFTLPGGPWQPGMAMEGSEREKGDVAVPPPARGFLCGVSSGELRFDKYILVVESGHAVTPGRNGSHVEPPGVCMM